MLVYETCHLELHKRVMGYMVCVCVCHLALFCICPQPKAGACQIRRLVVFQLLGSQWMAIFEGGLRDVHKDQNASGRISLLTVSIALLACCHAVTVMPEQQGLSSGMVQKSSP
eukprot:scaffold167695_cov16-Tisochrysis_lutea.AAC.1